MLGGIRRDLMSAKSKRFRAGIGICDETKRMDGVGWVCKVDALMIWVKIIDPVNSENMVNFVQVLNEAGHYEN